jgi:flavin reductase (DIM6/NTAB) family NADH-FMN oxidoreductase RutF
MIEHDAESLTGRERARIVKSAVTPRPIAWISSRSTDGGDNLAPYSSYNYVSSSGSAVTFHSPNEAHGGLKDSARNAVDTGEFAVNVVTEPLMEAMDHTSAKLPPGESEFDEVGIDRAECTAIDAPRVADAPVTMECRLHDTVEVFDTLMVIGEIVHFHLSESVLTDGEIDMHELPTVGRLGGPYYTVSDPVEFERQF